MQHKASIWPLPTVILAAIAGEKAEEPQPRPAAPGMSLSAAHLGTQAFLQARAQTPHLLTPGRLAQPLATLTFPSQIPKAS